MNKQHAAVAVFGASGHTGRFVVAEALERGLRVVAVGRDFARLPSGPLSRVASIDQPDTLRQAFAGCGVVINCAGPFLDTASPVASAAIAAGCSCIDVTAEQASALHTFDTFDAPAKAAGVAVIPAAGFYGGLADLLAAALVGSGPIQRLTVAVALDYWWPTAGTRNTGERNRATRVVIADGKLRPMTIPPGQREWMFGPPHGRQSVVEVPLSEMITVSRHLRVNEMHSYLTLRSLEQISDAATPTPTAVDGRGRSAQQFEMVVEASGVAGVRHAVARGQDIYAVSAPLVVEAAQRIIDHESDLKGALSLAQAFDAREFLGALAPEHLALEIGECTRQCTARLGDA